MGGHRPEHPHPDPADRRRRVERGTALVGTIAGVAVFLVLLTVAVQVALSLYARSVATAAAYDAARRVATGLDDPAGAEAHARSVLGGIGGDAVFEWDTGGDAVRLRVVVEPPLLIGGLGLEVIDRTVTVRTEEAGAGG